MVFTLLEIIEIIITMFIVGYIFSGFIKKPRHPFDELMKKRELFNWEDVKYATMITAPALVLHELGHKFASLAFGIPSHFHAILSGGSFVVFMTVFAIALKVFGSPFIILAPGFVAIEGSATPQVMAMIAFAGPAVNLALWAISGWMLKKGRWRHWHRELWLSKQINMWLFIFNMIPIGPLDGAKVLAGILASI